MPRTPRFLAARPRPVDAIIPVIALLIYLIPAALQAQSDALPGTTPRSDPFTPLDRRPLSEADEKAIVEMAACMREKRDAMSGAFDFGCAAPMNLVDACAPGAHRTTGADMVELLRTRLRLTVAASKECRGVIPEAAGAAHAAYLDYWGWMAQDSLGKLGSDPDNPAISGEKAEEFLRGLADDILQGANYATLSLHLYQQEEKRKAAENYAGERRTDPGSVPDGDSDLAALAKKGMIDIARQSVEGLIEWSQFEPVTIFGETIGAPPVEVASAEAAQDRLDKTSRESRPEPLALNNFRIGSVTIDDQVIFDNRTNAAFDFRQAELDVESLTKLRDEAEANYAAAKAGYMTEMAALDARGEATNARFDAALRQAPPNPARVTVPEDDDRRTAITRLEQRNATIADRLRYLRNDDPASAEIRQKRIADLVQEAEANSRRIGTLEDSIFQAERPHRNPARQRIVEDAVQDRDTAFADIARRRQVSQDRLERAHRPLTDAQSRLEAAETSLFTARTRYEDARNRDRLSIAKIESADFLRTYRGFRPRLIELDREIRRIADMKWEAQKARYAARQAMLDAGLTADFAGLDFARWAGASYFAQSGVEIAETMYSAAKDIKDLGPELFVLKTFFHTIPYKIVVSPKYYDGFEPTIAEFKAGAKATPVWKEMLGPTQKDAEATVVKKTGKAFAKAAVKYPVRTGLKLAARNQLERAVHKAMDSYLSNPDLGAAGDIQEQLKNLNKKSKQVADLLGKNGYKALARSFATQWGKELLKSAAKDYAKRKVAHWLTDDAWVDHLAAQLHLAERIQLFRDTYEPLAKATNTLKDLQQQRAELIANYNAETDTVDDRNDEFRPADGYVFTVTLAEDDPLKLAKLRPSATLQGVELTAIGSNDTAVRKFAVPIGGRRHFEAPDLPRDLELKIKLE